MKRSKSRVNFFPTGRCIHELFEQQVNKSPDAPALLFHNQTLSYRQLDQKANQLAHHLQNLGVGPEVLVAISLERSFEMMIGILGILKAGGAYVPLDPKAPEERLRFMLEDAKTKILLTQKHLKTSMPINDQMQIICLDADWKEIEKQPFTKANSSVDSNNLIYTIFTSGSTGKPKGVQVEHRNVQNLIEAQMQWVQDPVKRFLYAYSFAFDGAVLLIYWTLLQGATLVIADEELEKDVRKVSAFIGQHQISHLLTFPSLYSILLDQGNLKELQSLESVSVAGEACPAAMVKDHHRILPQVKLLNQYGPTEATVGATIYTTPSDFDDLKVPIGKAIEGARIYILNENLEKTKVGEIGEIYIGGKGVARGYLNRPELTAERFIADPFRENEKIYKTGDLAKYLSDENIDFVGRADYQVKLRGYRIELGEIEAAIAQYPDVLETVVNRIGETSTDQKLVAYLVLKNEKQITISQLRDFLSNTLPDYMIPAAMVILEKMPLTTAGKVDRKALPAPNRDRPCLVQKYIAPQKDLEKYLTQIWKEILDLDQIGIDDKFFELGGNSLQAARFINRLQEELGETIFIVTIFDTPTIGAYTKMLERDYPEALLKKFGENSITQNDRTANEIKLQRKLTISDFEDFSKLVPVLAEKTNTEDNSISLNQGNQKGPIFILAPPRSGTTLLRVMLAGHPDLFAANELQLLGFQNMEQRAEAYAGKFSLWKEGLVRTVMELKKWTADQAKNYIQEAEEKKQTTQAVYAELQEWIGEKILVDKSPSYVLDAAILEKAASDFPNAIFIHLVRHPYSMVKSFAKMHMDQVMYLKPHHYTSKEVGELIWSESHRNTLAFLKNIPANRQYRIQYEKLVKNPRPVMEDLCQTIGLDFHPNLIDPYKDIDQKMTDGIYQDSKPMGDVRLLEHKKINPQLADTWKAVEQDDFLSDTTKSLTQNFDYTTTSAQEASNGNSITDIAIIGMSGRFPGAKNIDELWQNLKSGKDVSRTFSEEELIAAGVDPDIFKDPDYVNRGMLMDDADCFDATFFGYHPKEAALMDPQHRIFLECAYAALEDAGYDPDQFDGKIGILGGIARNTYLVNNVITHPQYFKSIDDFQLGITLEKDFPATRVAYKLNLKGPALSVQTACSSSGVALHLACQNLLLGESDMMLVGGGRIQPPLTAGHLHKEGHALSPDGYCRTFDADAQGMVRGNGMSFIVIKKLADAIRDGDQIHAVIKATAINNDGADKIGFTAPSIKGQAGAIEQAYRKAGVDPSTISYVECHGTGTALGDPIEIAGLTQAFKQFTDKKGFCAVGSIKTNIGHLDAGACIAGIIKTVLALKHECLPASLHFKKPNPQIDFANSPFFVNDQLRDWKRGKEPRRAGVSSFGLGGTNVHVVLEEAPEIIYPVSTRSQNLLLLSAKTEKALNEATLQMADYLDRNPKVDLQKVAATLQLGRQHFKHRRIIVGKDVDKLVSSLQKNNPAQVLSAQLKDVDKKIVFMFPGGGAQHTNMGLQLYEEEPVFRKEINRCLQILETQHQLSLKTILYPDHNRNEPIMDPLHGITLLFSVEYATAQLLMSWGLIPTEMIGHSLGEYTAACIAGVMSLEEALALVTLRGRLFQDLPEGAMLSVPLSPKEVLPYMENDLSFAAINKPDHCVVSGSVEAIDNIKQKLNAEEIHSTRLHITVAAHSHMIEPILDEFGDLLDTIQFGEPNIPIVSNLSGTWVEADDIMTSSYWKHHLRQTVRFADGIETILGLSDRILLEVGPGQTLSTFARQHPAKQGDQAIMASLKHPKEQTPDLVFIYKTLGRLWLEGVKIDWTKYNNAFPFQRISLPTYPFEKQRHWIEAKPLLSHPSNEINQTFMENRNSGSTTSSNISQVTRKELLVGKVKDIFHQLSGIPIAEMNEYATFLELGFDSLFLTQATSKIKKTFKIKLSFRQLFEEAPTMSDLANYVDEQLPANALQSELDALNQKQNIVAPQVTPSVTPLREAPIINPVAQTPLVNPNPMNQPMPMDQPNNLEAILQRQLQIMEQQLALLGGQSQALPQAINSPQNQQNFTTSNLPPSTHLPLSTPSDSGTSFTQEEAKLSYGPWKALDKRSREDLTEREIKYLDDLIERYTSRTKGSQALTQKQRPHLADPRAITGFVRLWKDMIYQIAVERSKGSKLWDVDGNEYVDYRMAFGIALFGHTPDFIQKAVAEQLEKGTELGVLTPLANQVADLLCELSGMERATLMNTGSEAVSAAVRAARTVTGKDRILVFEGDYHGISDEMLVRSVNRNGRSLSVSAAPGVPDFLVENVVILNYDDPDVLQKIKDFASELAAVIIEPVQPNSPHLQRGELFHQIRAICTEEDIALIFDEMITGFRLGIGGAQEWFDIEVDLVAYGKIISGGLPMAAVAGKARFMDAFDGGNWNYGDDSIPEADLTFFGGTFVKHPLSLAASLALLQEIKKQGPALYDELNAKSARFAERLKALFIRTKVPLQVCSTASIVAIKLLQKNPLAKLFFYYLRLKGVHLMEKAGLISTAHTEADLDFTYKVIEETIREMQTAGFFPITVAEDAPDLNVVFYPNKKEKEVVSVKANEEKKNIPLTEGQKEVWVEQRLGDGAAAAYNLSSNIKLEGNLNVEALQKALQYLVDRHEALRTTYDKTTTTQSVRATWSMDFPLIDLSHLNESEKNIRFQELLQEEAENPMDVFDGPLFRSKIIRLDIDVHHLLMTAHHGIADGWSCGVLVKDLSITYSAIAQNKKVNLSSVKQLSDYAQEHDANRNSEEQKEAEAYWVEQFKNDIPVLDFPTDRIRPALKTYGASCEKTSIDHQLFQELKQVATQEGTTLFVMMYAAFHTFIHRLSGQNDFVLGIVAAGQSIAGNQDVVTHGVSLLPVRVSIGEEAPFSDHLKEVRGKILDAFDHQNYTLGSLVKKLNLPRDLSRQPIISILFNMDSAMSDMSFSDLKVDMNPVPRNYETFDIFINVKPTDKGVDFEWTYNTDLFKKETIQRRLEEFKTLLKGIVAKPSSTINRLPILPELENQQLTSWRDTDAKFPDKCCIHSLFEDQVKKTPHSIAVESQDQQLTYQELNERSNQLAQYLVNKGVRRGDFVGVYLDRSVNLLVGLLAVLKAGGIYVPLDPSNPAERLKVIIEDAEAAVLITEKSMLNDLPKGDWNIITLEDVRNEKGNETVRNLSIGCQPKDMAYIIYTSGSTGRPKGIVIPHYAVVDHHWAVMDMTGIDANDIMLSVASVSFDPSVQDFFMPLFIGGSVVIASQEEKVDGVLLKERIRKSGINFMQATPATWRMLLLANWTGGEDLKLMNMGEALTKELSHQLVSRSKELWNAYGPTETTIYTSLKKLEGDRLATKADGGYETIGYPMNNSQIYILDKWQQSVPIGVPGELYVGGVGVAPNGYYKRPELNKEKFIPNPFNENETVYRSGDRVRWLADGDIEFLGRMDHQVKVRGFRIELGEIESLLSQYGGIAENVAIVREDQTDNKRIVAYLILKEGYELNSQDLKQYLKEKLPDYMVPSAFVEMDQFPLTATLKIDRKKLPAPDYNREDLETGYVAPRNETEKALEKIWSKLLGVKEIGIHDNFFELGGHSLIAVSMMSEIEKKLDKKLPLASLLENATIKSMAYLLDKRNGVVKYNSLVPIKASGSKTPVYLIHGAGLHVLMFQTLASHMDADQPIYALQARGLEGTVDPLDKIEDIAAHYIAEVIQQNPDGPYALAGYSFGGLIAFEMAKQLEAMDKEVVMLGMFDTVIREHLAGTKEDQSYYQQMAKASKKMAWNLSLITRNPIPNLKYKSHVLKRRWNRWKWSLTNNEAEAIKDTNADRIALVDQMNKHAFESYKMSSWNGKIHLFRAKEQRFYLEDFEFLGWKPFAKKGVVIHEVPGDHLTLFNPPHGAEFAKVLQRCLDETITANCSIEQKFKKRI